MSPLFIIFGILAIIIPVGLCIFYKNKIDELTTDNSILKKRYDTLEERFNAEDANDTSATASAWEFIQRVGRNHQFEVHEMKSGDDWVEFSFSYQDGAFTGYAGTKDHELTLHYPCYFGIKRTPESFEKVRTLCQRATREFRFIKVLYTYHEQSNELDMHFLIEVPNVSEEAFMDYLKRCFSKADIIRQTLNGGHMSTEVESQDFARQERMLVDAEMQHKSKTRKQKNPLAPEPNHGTLREYIAYLFNGEDVEDMLALRIQDSKTTKYIRERDIIANFDILGAVVKGAGEEAEFADFEPVVLTLDAVKNHYVITLHPLKSRKDYLSVRMTAVCTPHEFLQDYVPNATYEPQAISMLLCYVKTELPAIEEDDEELPTTSNSKQVYHGRQLMQQNYFAQAISVLTPINKQLRANYFKLSKKDQDLYFSTCYYLGFCYTDLHLYEKAHYYLSTAQDCNRFDYSQEYINCLAECHDPRVFKAIDDEIQATRAQLDQIDKDEDRGSEEMMSHRERLVDYYAFLQRRRGYSQINFGYLDDAADTFKHLLEHEGSREYAEHELKYIETLKKQKK